LPPQMLPRCTGPHLRRLHILATHPTTPFRLRGPSYLGCIPQATIFPLHHRREAQRQFRLSPHSHSRPPSTSRPSTAHSNIRLLPASLLSTMEDLHSSRFHHITTPPLPPWPAYTLHCGCPQLPTTPRRPTETLYHRHIIITTTLIIKLNIPQFTDLYPMPVLPVLQLILPNRVLSILSSDLSFPMMVV
jgi:hypothetical protein